MSNARTIIVSNIAAVLNQTSRENVSNTPDCVLAEVAMRAIEEFEKATLERERWYGTGLDIGGPYKITGKPAPWSRTSASRVTEPTDDGKSRFYTFAPSGGESAVYVHHAMVAVFNAIHGHAITDEVLAKVPKRFHHMFKESDE